ncbi:MULTISPECIES: hypothetical protein [unclassified Sinorhizobium]|uniref:hypothetical protein n=1 Tax=unclassified Sinorhizobium TaxID=2613772 RepID=UPI003523CE7B
MTGVLLSDDNLYELKAYLRRRLSAFAFRSSHITEAMAAALSFKTHASLLAAIRQQPGYRPLIGDFQVSAFLRRLTSFNISTSVAAISIQAEEIRALPDRTWLDAGRAGIELRDVWFHECKLRDIPFLYVVRNRKYGELHWDCVSIDPGHESHVQGQEGTELVRSMFSTYQTIAGRLPNKSEFFGSSFVGSIKGLPLELLGDMADEIFMSLYRPLQRYKLPTIN